MSEMNTFTGRIFDPLKMMKQDVCVEDIAHALSRVAASLSASVKIRWASASALPISASAIFFRWRSIR